MRVENNLLLSSIRALSTDQTKIQTPHNLFRDFRADKTFTTVGQAAEFKFESKFNPLPVIWKSLPRAIPEDK